MKPRLPRLKLPRFTKRLLALAFGVWYVFFALPGRLFQVPYSTVLEDRHGILLGARIAADGQWRFPPADSIPVRFRTALLTFEDQRFDHHPGVDLRAFGRALWQNLRNGRTVSGGSTLTMQTIRLSRENPRRTVWEKFTEMLRATRLEWRWSKDEILRAYAAHAPFGGNVVGLEAAAWRYYGKRPELLSWSEAATLAVLPNAPALIHPGRNRDALRAKRDRLLDRLLAAGHLSDLDHELAREEPLPERPRPLPRRAPHLLDRMAASAWTSEIPSRTRSDLDASLQRRVHQILDRHRPRLTGNRVFNAGAVVLHVPTGETRAYVGNLPGTVPQRGAAVDVVRARRSTGSILKPFLYALATQDGTILPQELLLDVPTQMSGFRPVNFLDDYAGVVPADRALSRSLNIPFVRLLHDYGLERFHDELGRLGFSTFNQTPDHYGLSLILGGGEVTLHELAHAYRDLAKTLLDFYPNQGRYAEEPTINAAACWQTFQAMEQLERPGTEGRWKRFRNSRRLAWKTGTSHGFRDAWAVGVTPEWVVGIWVGNADGEGRPGLVGVRAAAPLLFDVFRELPVAEYWFDPPFDELHETEVCTRSGQLRGRHCPAADTVWINRLAERATDCVFHQRIFLNEEQQRVRTDCTPDVALPSDRFVLPPLAAHYHARRDPTYAPLPDWHPDCATAPTDRRMAFIYPNVSEKIHLPTDFDGKRNGAIFRVAHTEPRASVHWHLDGDYLTTTTERHELELRPEPGRHTVTLVDSEGFRLERRLEFVR